MKTILILLLVLIAPALFAQENLPVVHLPQSGTFHFVSPEPIQYVDISTPNLIGDLPLKNVLRLKLRDTLKTFSSAVITIAGEKFIAQYRILPGDPSAATRRDVLIQDMRPLDIPGIGLSQNQLTQLALRVLVKKPDKRVSKVKAFGIKGQVNQIYSIGDYVFIDLAYRNYTSLVYDIADLRFQLDDKKITKATNSQSVPITPEFALLHTARFAKNYRNILVLKKMSFPGNKVLHIELSEKQLSGRVVTLNISYQDLLDADTLAN